MRLALHAGFGYVFKATLVIKFSSLRGCVERSHLQQLIPVGQISPRHIAASHIPFPLQAGSTINQRSLVEFAIYGF